MDIGNMDHTPSHKAGTTNDVQPNLSLPQLFSYANQVKRNQEKHPTKPPDEVYGTAPKQQELPPGNRPEQLDILYREYNHNHFGHSKIYSGNRMWQMYQMPNIHKGRMQINLSSRRL